VGAERIRVGFVRPTYVERAEESAALPLTRLEPECGLRIRPAKARRRCRDLGLVRPHRPPRPLADPAIARAVLMVYPRTLRGTISVRKRGEVVDGIADWSNQPARDPPSRTQPISTLSMVPILCAGNPLPCPSRAPNENLVPRNALRIRVPGRGSRDQEMASAASESGRAKPR
jgi:hypothetical protein